MIIDLTEIKAGMLPLVGGKALGLAELIRAGEQVPAGFCLTTDPPGATGPPGPTPVPNSDSDGGDDLAEAYERLGGGPVAVRSSATAEDLPDASFAGLHDTFLGVSGVVELRDAVRRCRESVRSERVVAYREANGIPESRMAVVVQRMVDPVVAGVLYTANPVTGRRTEMVVDAAPGLGTAVVDGSVVPDHYVLGAEGVPEGGCLGSAQLAELREAGHRLRKIFGAPQDVEWAFDGAGVLWILQSRPITTLFPAPPESAEPRVYLELGGQFQGVFQPFTPMGSAVLRS
ncbi:MAG: PEP/pyruvate-binding domain-containing protein, partial [Actinoplanes sp.]